jgi:hypothetical protein
MEQSGWVDKLIDEEDEMEAIEEYRSALGRAVSIWQKGNHIPLTMYHELLEDGYDVQMLEARYFTH